MSGPDEWIAEELSGLSARGLRRELRVYPAVGGKYEVDGRTVLNFSSNDYLNLTRNPTLKQRAKEAIDRYGCGAASSRLITGTTPLHDELECRLAELEGREAALVFGSGYLANVGSIGALVGRGDAVFSDRLNHASIVDGILLSGAKLYRYRHCDCSDLESQLKASGSGRKLIVTDSVFSMDGDIAPISDILALCRQYGAMLMVDEAHGTGIFGKSGGGVTEDADPGGETTVCMGTLSKALASYGGFIAGSRLLRDLLVNRARSFMYTTALPPASAASALAALDLIRERPTMGAELLRRAETFRSNLRSMGLDTAGSTSQIIPILVGDNEKTLALSRALADRTIVAPAVRPPTVPAGSARLRLSLTLAHDNDDLEFAAGELRAAAVEIGLL